MPIQTHKYEFKTKQWSFWFCQRNMYDHATPMNIECASWMVRDIWTVSGNALINDVHKTMFAFRTHFFFLVVICKSEEKIIFQEKCKAFDNLLTETIAKTQSNSFKKSIFFKKWKWNDFSEPFLQICERKVPI